MAITIKDIARMAGVSTTTVSKIINKKDNNISQKTRDKVMSFINEYNYIPSNIARSMVTKRSNTIGLIIPDVCNPFLPELARGVEDEAGREAYSVFFCNTDESLAKEIASVQALNEKMVEGIVIVPAIIRDNEQELKLTTKIPMVTIDREANYSNIVGRVITDNYTGSYEAVQYLIAKNHKKIAFISGPINIMPSVERKRGYLTACRDAGLEASDSDIYIGQFDPAWGEQAIDMLNRDYTAFFCGNDLIAAGVIKGLAKKGIKVPNQVSVIGFDDITLASYLHPELTTVRQESYEIGRQSAKILFDSIKNKDTNIKDLTLKAKLIIRNSTN
ncbi:LacI family DNA-binding transcriptional regulator [Clostridium sp. 'deep sea']|uniref:LacI family DNA-binding transcriptional regulator n=1 Tax=Clostridium sp. 'deep sea' TaxID=2779445 RepID=UPI0018966B69|nr:LacI family DNA-binding transcriptional regulator [Clostridium sp. 'deep sea']QOR35379.1 LacI family DNA-binding transcriptional regulator [Clostridium sp. 'deep sea']